MHRQVEEYGDEVFDKLDKGAHIYFCGLKGMMPGILTMLESVAKKKKIDWEEFIKELKEKGKRMFHFFVYGRALLFLMAVAINCSMGSPRCSTREAFSLQSRSISCL